MNEFDGIYLNGTADTAFVAFWNDGGEDSFAADPPNATLSIFNEDEIRDVVIELRNPRLEGEYFIYDITIIDGEDLLEPTFLEQTLASSLFIDVVGMPLTPLLSKQLLYQNTFAC